MQVEASWGEQLFDSVCDYGGSGEFGKNRPPPALGRGRNEVPWQN